MVVPRSWEASVLEWDRGRESRVVSRTVWGRDLQFLVERTLDDCFHACSVDDVVTVLNHAPKRHVNNYRDVSGIKGIVLRQPTRKEDRLVPVWGRLGYGVRVGRDFGPVIFLAAQRLPMTLRWSKRLGSDDRLELQRLIEFADDYRFDGRHHELHMGLGAVRRVQLFHTLLHELGHWADMYEKVELPALDAGEAAWSSLWNGFFLRSCSERESFANRYSDEVRSRLQRERVISFGRKVDRQRLLEEGLRPEDFLPPDPPHRSSSVTS